jgi:hypothetical protein
MDFGIDRINLKSPSPTQDTPIGGVEPVKGEKAYFGLKIRENSYTLGLRKEYNLIIRSYEMQKSIEERIAALESGINRVVKMQTCVFKLVQAQHRISTFLDKTQWDMASVKDSVESVQQHMNNSVTFMFGSLATLGISLSMIYVYSGTHDFFARVSAIFTLILGSAFYVVAFRYNRLANKQRLAAKSELCLRLQLPNIKEEAATLDEEMARVLAEWEKLVPDDSASKLKSEN